LYKPFDFYQTVCSLIICAIGVAILAGCNGDQPRPTPPPLQAAAPSTQPAITVAEMSTLKISKIDLDHLLYESYGLRMMFDLLELDLAKATLAQQGGKLLPQDVQRERQLFLQKIGQDAPQSDWENLFQQALQQEHISNAEFDVKVLQTNACLRKIVEPIVINQIPDDKVRRAYEQLYGAKRRIADITLGNIREAQDALGLLQTESFAQVARDMSLDRETAARGGEWPAFSAQSHEIPDVIRNTAFSLEKNQVSATIVSGDKYHLIKLLEIIPPKVVKYEDVKDYVRKQLENALIEADIKRLREELVNKTQALVQIDDPTLAAQWKELKDKASAKDTDHDGLAKQLDAEHRRAATNPAATQASP
jgi:parvulin-like peptidyl-prolyl isomerase